MKSKLATTIKLLNKTEKDVYRALTMSLFAISFLSIFTLRPSLQVITAYRKNLAEAQKVNEALTTKINNLEKARQNIKRQDTEIKKLNIALPEEFNQSELLKSLSFLASSSKTTILKTSFDIPSKSGFVETIKISLDTHSTLEDLYVFLQKLEQEPRYIKINSVIIQTTETEITAKISAEVFYANYVKR